MSEREAAEQFLEHLAVPIRQIGADGTILWANQAELDMLGYGRDEYVGHHIREFHAERAVVEDMCTRMAAGEPLFDYEARFVAKNGDIRHISVTSNAYMRDGALVHTRCVSRDITETRKKETEREELVADLARTVRLNEMFASILGHDLRNPLNAIVMATQMLLGQVTDPKAQRAAQRVLSSSDRMRRMIDQLLDFARARMLGGLPLDRKDTDLAAVVRDALEEVRFVRPTWPVELTIDGETHGSWDAARLAQVMSNLFGNAAQHGTAEVPLDVRIDGTNPDKIVLTVTNGGSIPHDLLPMIFAPFRGKKYKDAKTTGLGLGLFISEQIVRAHQGDITAKVEGDKTTFTVSLPRRPIVAMAATFEQRPASTTEMTPLTRPRKSSEDVMRTFVRSIRDYAIFMLDANGLHPDLERRRAADQGLRAGRDHRPATSRVFYTPRGPRRAASPARARRRAPHDGRVRGRGLARAQGRHALLGERRHHRAARRRRRARRLREGHARPDRAQARPRSALRQSEERFRLLVESVQDYAIFMLDPDGNVATWNAGAQRIKGYRADEIIGQHFSRVLSAGGRARRQVRDASSRSRRATGRFEDEGWRVRKDGTRFWANVVITAAVRLAAASCVGFAQGHARPHRARPARGRARRASRRPRKRSACATSSCRSHRTS